MKERAAVCIVNADHKTREDAHLEVRRTVAYQKIRAMYPLDLWNVAWVGSEIVCGCWHVTFEAELKGSELHPVPKPSL